MKVKKQPLFPKIEATLQFINKTKISTKRQEVLQPLINYLREKTDAGKQINLNFICTHNSRRSHLSQIWAQTIAHYIGLKNIYCYSGGTEATALYPMVVKILKNSGFEIIKITETENPVYAVKFSDTVHPVVCFSKTYDASFNPKSGFGAIMTCNSANEACPIVKGAESRFPITYEDPKVFDRTPLQAEKYHERSIQIATELLYVFKTAKEA
ncbi:low molecular weight phosphatase family protein [uncultured Croceitalea sp.]|uniref:arsenate-mycothiol transferase ArsC n=1 Tax=uncultured Croceitalea sp. TaxID=1798908 RepID=UPI00374F39E7